MKCSWPVGSSEQEQAEELQAYQRQYEDEHSWEQLQEDEFGRLKALV